MTVTPNDLGAHHRRNSSGFVHASNTMLAGPLTVRVTTSSRSDFRSTVVGFFGRSLSFIAGAELPLPDRAPAAGRPRAALTPRPATILAVELRQGRLTASAVTTERPGDRRGPIMRTFRNGLAEVPYAYRARSYPWAVKALAAAEAQHGKPVPVCGACGARLTYNGGHGRCPACAA